MKNALPITLFLVLFLLNQKTVSLGSLPGVFVWSLEALIVVIAVIVIARLIARNALNLPLKYLLLFGGFIYVTISGIIINEVPILTIIAGIRTYFKYIPIFLLPFAFDYSINDLKKQFTALILLGLVQAPVSIWQKFVLFKYVQTGDGVSGTLNSSNSISIVVISMIIMLFALYFRKMISLKLFILISVILFIPATLNETKITPIILVVGLGTLLFVLRKELSLKQFTAIVASALSLLIMFVLLYNSLYTQETGPKFADKISKEHLIDNYAYQGYKADPTTILEKQTKIVGENRDLPDVEMGRLDSILIPLDVLFNGDDIGKLFFGLGIGNVNSSRADAKYTYINKLGGTSTTLALLLWETGIVGAFIFIIILILIAKDSLKLTENEGEWNTFSIAWFGISLISVSLLLYNNFFHINELACLFMYFSGLIIVAKHKLNWS